MSCAIDALKDLSGSLYDAFPPEPLALDPGFRPLSLGLRAWRRALAASPRRVRLAIVLERGPEGASRLDLDLFPEGMGRDEDNFRHAFWMLSFLLWSRGGYRVALAGPAPLCRALAGAFAGPRAFDGNLMTQAYRRPFQMDIVPPAELPPERHRALALGGHLEGCRLGFDLGASDFKVAAVKDGETVFSAELPWNPRDQTDPSYHLARLDEGLRLAASHLPRVDAIGGSSAGILVDNRVRVSSLFRGVPPSRFVQEVEPVFLRLQEAWGVPLEVLNDGEVTALAGALSLERSAILGLAMGSSEAVGFLDRSGHLTDWINELAFAPVDADPDARTDDWSGNPGVGAATFSQQGVAALARGRFPFPESMPLADRLLAVQASLAAGDERAMGIFDTIGAGLGYALPWYREFYDFDCALVLGRVATGSGGERILAGARRVLEAQFPEAGLEILLPDEKARRVGQAVAAASLPTLSPGPVQPSAGAPR